MNKFKQYLPQAFIALAFLAFVSGAFYLGRLTISRELSQQPKPEIFSPTAIPTPSPSQSPIPTNTKIISPTSNPGNKLTYKLPVGWKTYVHPSGLYSIGYNPATQTPMLYDNNDLWITYKNLNNNSNYAAYSSSSMFTIMNYDGGSRHAFLEKAIGGSISENKLSDYYEENYTIDGKSCLVLHGVQISQSNTIHGMCVISSTKALAFGTYNYADLSPLLNTLKFSGINQSNSEWQIFHDSKLGYMIELPKRFRFNPIGDGDQYYKNIGVFSSSSGEQVILKAIVGIDIYANETVENVATREIIDSNQTYALQPQTANGYQAAIINILNEDKRRIITIKSKTKNLYIQITVPPTLSIDNELMHLLDTFRFDS